MNFNPMQMLQMLNGMRNPKNLVMNMIKNQMGNNPMITNLINMADSGNTQGIETFARNICEEKGVNFDTEFKNFMNQVNQNMN